MDKGSISTMKAQERLVNILSNAPLELFTFGDRYSIGTIQKVADHLLANGVIVPPCKVGDKVYVLSNGMILQTEIIRVKYEEEAENYSKFIRERVYAVLCNIEREFDFSDFGKTVFLTKEEAEQALSKSVTDTNVGDKLKGGAE